VILDFPASALALQLITLHQPDGRVIHVNPAEITFFAAPRRDDKQLLVSGSNCVVFLTTRRYFGVVETCEAVRQLLGGAP
jgi:hypothetical protein